MDLSDYNISPLHGSYAVNCTYSKKIKTTYYYLYTYGLALKSIQHFSHSRCIMRGRQVAVHEKRSNPLTYIEKSVIAKNILSIRLSLSSCKITDKGNISKKHSWTILPRPVEMHSLRAEFTYFRNHKAPKQNDRITQIWVFPFFF